MICSINDKAWKDYCVVNQKFADVIVENYRPGDIGIAITFIPHLPSLTISV